MPTKFSKKQLEEMFGQSTCDLCGERLSEIDVGEFYNPSAVNLERHYIAHASCASDNGFEMA